MFKTVLVTFRYWFNAATGQCESFQYSGCGGNSNNFRTQLDCQTACQGTTSLSNLLTYLRTVLKNNCQTINFNHRNEKAKKKKPQTNLLSAALTCIQGLPYKDSQGRYATCQGNQGNTFNNVITTCPSQYDCYYDGFRYGCCPTKGWHNYASISCKICFNIRKKFQAYRVNCMKLLDKH